MKTMARCCESSRHSDPPPGRRGQEAIDILTVLNALRCERFSAATDSCL
jgi:hypothetical protein